MSNAVDKTLDDIIELVQKNLAKKGEPLLSDEFVAFIRDEPPPRSVLPWPWRLFATKR